MTQYGSRSREVKKKQVNETLLELTPRKAIRVRKIKGLVEFQLVFRRNHYCAKENSHSGFGIISTDD